jgi:dTDP-glucose 4,6-dehydratase
MVWLNSSLKIMQRLSSAGQEGNHFMRVLISGAAGFLGSHLTDSFLADGHSVIGVDNLCTGSMTNIEHLKLESRFEFLEHDICLSFDPGKVDYVFNFASPASPPGYLKLGIETLMVGSVGTRQMLEIAKHYGAKFLQASTSECYGDPTVHPQREDYWGNVNPVGPRSVYDEAKRFSEALVMAYYRYHRVDTHIVRIFNTYGPRLHEADGRVISNFVSQAVRGEDLTVYGDGSQTRSFCYVSDEIEGIVGLSRTDEHLPVNVGNPCEWTILECAEAVIRVTGSVSKIVYRSLPQDDPLQRRPDISKAERLFGWVPKIDLETGLRLSLKYFRKCAEANP